jgi:hypothetical protein
MLTLAVILWMVLGAAFNPDPFIATLEGAIEQLLPLQDQVDKKIKTLEKDVAQKERSYRTRIDDFKNGLNVSLISPP